ncbi:MAG: hypothetical protein LCI00_08410 [Chloroflexi bacterium]|nr:hypothetical protein [Chloroflexota bacterium]
MAEQHILAVHTYGSQRVKRPDTNQMVSAYKIGYSSAACEVLLALYETKARDVSSSHATYRYVQIDGDTSVRHGYLLLSVTDDELARAKAVACRHHRAAVFVWREDKWLELPNSRDNRYVEPVGHSGPGFNPSGFRPVSPSSGEKEPAVEGIRVEKSQRNPQERPWWWILGDTYPQRETLKRFGARFSSRHRAWYYVGWELPDGIQKLVTHIADAHDTDVEAKAADLPTMSPELEAQILEVLAQDDAAVSHGQVTSVEDTHLKTEPPVETEKPTIRVMKPISIPTDGTPLNEVQTAIVQAKTQPTSVIHSDAFSQKRTLVAIGQSCVGELTGSISGNVWCYGYAIHDGICIFVNMGGPRMAVEAIRAKFSKGEIVNCVPWDAPAVELTAGEENSGMYHDYMQNIPEAKFTSLILCHDLLVNPNYGGNSTTFILRTDEAQAAAKLKHYITELVKVPVFDDWAGYLYHAGQTAMLLRQTRSAGEIDLLTVDLDVDAWTRLITGGIEQGVITLPTAS